MYNLVAAFALALIGYYLFSEFFGKPQFNKVLRPIGNLVLWIVLSIAKLIIWVVEKLVEKVLKIDLRKKQLPERE